MHGAAHTGRCWAPLLGHLDQPSLTVDLPGRETTPRALAAVGLGDAVAAVVDTIERSPFDRVVLVGHSLAGAALPGVVAELPERIAHVVYISATIPPPGRSVVDTLPAGIRPYARWVTRRRRVWSVPRALAWLLFCNGLSAEQRTSALDGLCPESTRLMSDPLGPAAVAAGRVPATYVMLRRDRTLPVRNQRRHLARLGPCEVATIDAGHEGFVSRPAEMAEALNRVARLTLEVA